MKTLNPLKDKSSGCRAVNPGQVKVRADRIGNWDEERKKALCADFLLLWYLCKECILKLKCIERLKRKPVIRIMSPQSIISHVPTWMSTWGMMERDHCERCKSAWKHGGYWQPIVAWATGVLKYS